MMVSHRVEVEQSMRFLGVSPLRYIKSEEISPVERMTANEWGSQPAHSAKCNRRRLSALG